MQAPILSHFVKFFYNSIHNFVVVTDNKTWFIIRHVPIVSQFYLKALNQFNVKHFVEMDRFQIFFNTYKGQRIHPCDNPHPLKPTSNKK